MSSSPLIDIICKHLQNIRVVGGVNDDAAGGAAGVVGVAILKDEVSGDFGEQRGAIVMDLVVLITLFKDGAIDAVTDIDIHGILHAKAAGGDILLTFFAGEDQIPVLAVGLLFDGIGKGGTVTDHDIGHSDKEAEADELDKGGIRGEGRGDGEGTDGECGEGEAQNGGEAVAGGGGGGIRVGLFRHKGSFRWVDWRGEMM
jgi:hypothetical protein